MSKTRTLLDLYLHQTLHNVHIDKIDELKNSDGTPNLTAITQREQTISTATSTLETIFDKPSASFPEATQFKTPHFQIFTFTKSGIIKINATYKNNLITHIAPRAIVIHVGDHHPHISSIKLNFFHPRSESLFPLFPSISLVTVQLKNNTKDFFLNYDNDINTILCDLWLDALSLGLVEIRFKKNTLKDNVKPKEYWDHWCQITGSEKIYQVGCDPAMIQQFIDFIVPLKKSLLPNQKLIILDIGAGNGRLAKKILEIAACHQLPLHYYFIEPSTTQITLAKTALAKSITSQCTITFINATLDKINLDEQVNCIISSGGPINRSIVSQLEAKNNLKKLATLLSPQGIMLATGLSPFLVKGKDFVANGLKPLRYSSLFTIPADKRHDDTYKHIHDVFASFFCLATYVCKKLPPIKPATEMIDAGNKLHSGKVYLGSFTGILQTKKSETKKLPLLYKPF